VKIGPQKLNYVFLVIVVLSLKELFLIEHVLCLLSLCSEKCTVYIGSHSHQFVALSVSSGVALWQTYLGDRIESSAALSLCRRLLIVGEWFVYSTHSF